LYIGEAQSLKSRLSQARLEIPNWSHFRFNVLPPALESFRVEIERMLIRDFAILMTSNLGKVQKMKILNFKLTNKKIDH
jgi:hypothetical protein